VRAVHSDVVTKGVQQVNQYEIAILYDPDLEIDLEKATSRVEKIFTDNGGKVTNTDNWGKRKLAYPIKKNETAVYDIYTVDIPGPNVAKIESKLNITYEVNRILITKPDLKAIAKAEAAKAEKAKKAAERGESADEDDEKDKEEE
jgi:small subunit ribosomal protein S6